MKAFKKTSDITKLTRKESLECKPMKSIHVKETRLETGDVLLTYLLEMRPWLARLIRRFGGPDEKNYTKKLQLDGLGTTVWELMDGKRTVRQIILKFAKNYQLPSREAEVAVTRFLHDLGKRGIIGLK